MSVEENRCRLNRALKKNCEMNFSGHVALKRMIWPMKIIGVVSLMMEYKL